MKSREKMTLMRLEEESKEIYEKEQEKF